jgi:hypothetical protein
MRGANELLGISSFLALETCPEGICGVAQHAALGGNGAAAIFEAALPDSGSFSIHVLTSPLAGRSRVTLAEIEEAADALPLEQKQELLRFLASRVNGERDALHRC